MAGLLMGLIGAVVGTMTGVGPAVGYAVGSAIGGAIGPKDTVEGPRLDDLRTVDSAYGKPIPRIRGGYRVPGMCIWAMPELLEIRTEEEEKKGPTVVSYSYYFTGAIALCQAPDEGIAGIGRIWINGDVVFDARPGAAAVAFENASDSISNYMRLHKGRSDQARDPRIEAESPNCSAYRNIAYIVFEDLPVKDYGNRFPNIEVEVFVGTDMPKSADYSVPELLHFVHDAGHGGALRPMMTHNRTDVIYAMNVPFVGENINPDNYKLYMLSLGKKPKIFDARSISSIASTTVPPTMFGPNIIPSTPYQQRGRPGFSDFTIKGAHGAFGISRFAVNGLVDYEVFKRGIHGFDGKIINTFNETLKLGQSPTLGVSIDSGIFIIVNLSEHRILRAVPFGVFYEFSATEKIVDFSSAGEFFYAATSQGSVLRIHQFDNDGPTGVSVVHPTPAGVFRIHAGDDGRVFTCTQSYGTIGEPLWEIMQWDPSSGSGFESIGKVLTSFEVSNSDHLGQAKGKTAYLGSIGGLNGIANFFWTNGYICLFDAHVGSLSDSYGGAGVAGAVLRSSRFGANIKDPTVGEICAEFCAESTLEPDMYDTSLLDQEYVEGYQTSKTMTARAAMEPLQKYFPFDCVENGSRLVFIPRGGPEVATLTEQDLGAEIVA